VGTEFIHEPQNNVSGNGCTIRRQLTSIKIRRVNTQNPPDEKLPEPWGEILINPTERLHGATS
jgi:hypothetical protein